jgi:hypothetical protein
MTDENKDNFGGSETPSADHKPNRLAERLATVEAGKSETSGDDGGADSYGRSHFVNPSGRMVIGARSIAPKLSPMELSAALARQQLFSSTGDGHRRGFSSGAVALFMCALTAGTTVGLAALVDGQDNDAGGSSSHAGQKAEQTVAATAVPAPAAAPVQTAQVLDRREAPKQILASVTPDAQAEPTRFHLVNAPGGNVVLKNAVAEPGRPAPLDITVNYTDTGEYAFLMFRGMPNGFKLSTGFRLKESWAVSLRELAGLQLIPPTGYRGPVDLEVLLVKGRDTPIESQRMVVNFSAQRGNAEPVAPAPAPMVTAAVPATVKAVAAAPAVKAAAPAPVPHVLTSTPPITEAELKPEPKKAQTVSLQPESTKLVPKVSAAEEEQMLDRALNFLRDGDIASARLLLEHLARKGSGKAAMALGQTFDPVFFRSMNTLGGLRPDRGKAQAWYKMAVDLGQPGAQQRLEGLSSE